MKSACGVRTRTRTRTFCNLYYGITRPGDDEEAALLANGNLHECGSLSFACGFRSGGFVTGRR